MCPVEMVTVIPNPCGNGETCEKEYKNRSGKSEHYHTISMIKTSSQHVPPSESAYTKRLYRRAQNKIPFVRAVFSIYPWMG